MRRLISVVLAGLALSGIGAEAHHSIAAVYDSQQQVTIEGVVARFAFINPHPFITLEVKNAAGQVQSWHLEMDNRFELADIGVTADTFKSGDRVVVSGSPGRAQALSLYIRKLDRPADGFQYEQAGSSPRIRTAK